MKRKLILGGRVAVVVSLVLVTWSIKLCRDAREVARFPFTPTAQSQKFQTDECKKPLCRTELELEIFSESVDEDDEGFDTYNIRYSIPFTLEVIDGNGALVSSVAKTVQWDESVTEMAVTTHSGGKISLAGGTEVVSLALEKFHLTASPLTVRVAVQPDVKYHAQVQSAELIIHDNESEHGARLALSAFLLLAGYYAVKIGKASGADTSEKSRTMALLLCFVVGMFGAHRFYVGRNISAVIMLFTLGGIGIWGFVDTITILFGLFLDAKGNRVRTWS